MSFFTDAKQLRLTVLILAILLVLKTFFFWLLKIKEGLLERFVMIGIIILLVLITIYTYWLDNKNARL